MSKELENQQINVAYSSNVEALPLQTIVSQQNTTQLKCDLALESINEAANLFDALYGFLDTQSNIIGSTVRKNCGQTDLSEYLHAVQAQTIRFVKASRKFILDVKGISHLNVDSNKIDFYISESLKNIRNLSDNLDSKAISTFCVQADLRDQYTRMFVLTEKSFSDPLLVSTKELIDLIDSALFKITDVVAAKNNVQNLCFCNELTRIISKTEALVRKVATLTIGCVKGIQSLIEYGSSAFINELPLVDNMGNANTVSILETQAHALNLANALNLPSSDDQVLKIGYAAMKILSALHLCCRSAYIADGAGNRSEWYAVNKLELERQFTSEHYSSGRIENALIVLEWLGYVEINASQMSQTAEHYQFRINYTEIAKSLITKVVIDDDIVSDNAAAYATNAILSTDKVDATRNTKMPFVVYGSAEKCATVRKGRRSYSRKFMIADKDLPIAA